MDATASSELVVSGPFLANRQGVYTRQRGLEQWALLAFAVVGMSIALALPLSMSDLLAIWIGLIVGCGVGSVIAAYWRQRRPLPLMIQVDGTLMCFSPGLIPRLLARFPIGTVSSVALSPAANGFRLDWLFRSGDHASFICGQDLRLGTPLAFFLNDCFDARFKDRRA